MDDTITIRTSDDPPVRLEASRAVLAANSKVFADMLSVPQSTTTAKHGAIDVAEHKIEIMPFLRLLNLAHEQGEALQELEDKDWPVVAKLADKYDSAVAKAMALAKCWKWNSVDDPDDDDEPNRAAAFKTAATLGHAPLTKAFLFDLLEKATTKGEVNSALRGRRPQFVKWADQAKELALKMSLGAVTSPVCSVCNPTGLHAGFELTWLRAMREAISDWQPYGAAKPFHRAAATACGRSQLCPFCRTGFMNCAERFEMSYRSQAPSFPS